MDKPVDKNGAEGPLSDLDLDLETAAYDEPQKDLPCAHCDKTLTGKYYQVDGAISCGTCKDRLSAEPQGSPTSRFLKAGLFGLVAAAAGSFLYYLFTKLTGWEFGLIAIALGFGIGLAVMAGSGGRGGLAYQLLAVFLTYLAIGCSYLPFAYQGLSQQAAPQSGVSAPSGLNSDMEPDRGLTDGFYDESTGDINAGEAASAAATGLGALLLLALALPVVVGMQSFISVIIIGIALWQAFKIPALAIVEVKGPFDLRGIASPAPVPQRE